jgi:tetraacyldisaccharide 4'-kinase
MDPTPVWYGRHPLSLALAPLGWVYCAGAMLRRLAYRSGRLESRRLPVPVAVVGNLSVGGTGKTPLVLALAELAVERGWRPGILIRGYRGTASDWPRTVRAEDDPALVGDEALLLARRGPCPVIAGPDRVASGELAISTHGCNLLLCDDGLQHYRLARDLELAVIDGERGLGNGRCLPAGPLREPRGRLRAVDFQVANGGPPGAWDYRFELKAGDAASLSEPGRVRPLESFQGQRVAAVAGIGNPGRFFAMLRERGILVEEWPYPDHHPYGPSDLEDWPPGPVLMTEKDAVKCGKVGRADLWYCPVRAEPEPALVAALFSKLPSPPASRV